MFAILPLCLGVVGTRRPTPYGLAVAERISGDLAHAGLTIASGMARGIDRDLIPHIHLINGDGAGGCVSRNGR